MKKRWLSFLLSLSMIAGSFAPSASVFAEDMFVSDTQEMVQDGEYAADEGDFFEASEDAGEFSDGTEEEFFDESNSTAEYGGEADPINPGLEGTPEKLEDGVYTAKVTDNGGMFKITNCTLVVKDGQMNAVMTLSGTGYDRIYLGSAAEAQNAPEEDLISGIKRDGVNVIWYVPVPALDTAIQAAARSARYAVSRPDDCWYDKSIIVESAEIEKASEDLIPTMAMEAEKWIHQFAVGKNIVTNFPDEVTRNGDTYTVPYYSASNAKIDKLKMLRPSKSVFRSGWFIPDQSVSDNWFNSPKKATTTTYKVVRSGNTDCTFDMTLKLYDPVSASDTTINNGTAEALAEYTFTVNLLKKPEEFPVTFQAVNSKDDAVISNAVITVTDKYGATIAAGADGTYTLRGNEPYTVTVTADGFLGKGGETTYGQTVTVTGPTTISLPMTPATEARIPITVKAVDDKGDIPTAAIVVKDSDNETVDPEEDGTYLLWEGGAYTCTVTDATHFSATKSFTASADTPIVEVPMTAMVMEFRVTINVHSFDSGEAIEDARISVTYEEEGETRKLNQNPDGTWSMKRGVMYSALIQADGFQDRLWEGKPEEGGQNEETFSVNLSLQLNGNSQLEAQITASENVLAEITEGTEPLLYPEGTKAELQEAIDAAKGVLENPAVSDEEKMTAASTLKTATTKAVNGRNPEVLTITFHYNTTAGGPAKAVTLPVRSDMARKAGYFKAADKRSYVTVIDALTALHQYLYGEDFSKASTSYLDENMGYLMKLFGLSSGANNLMCGINNKSADALCCSIDLSEGDVLSAYIGVIGEYYEYWYIPEAEVTAEPGQEAILTLMRYDKEGTEEVREPLAGYTIVLEDETTGERLTAVTDTEGRAAFQTEKIGAYTVADVSRDGVRVGVLPYGKLAVDIHVHKLVKTESREATCTENGNIAYWTCESCGKLFRDENGTEEIGAEDIVLEKTAHKYENGICTVCGAKDPDYVKPTEAPTPTETPKPTETPAVSQKQTLILKVSTGKTNAVLTWNKLKGVDGYKIYGSKCGDSYKLLKTVPGTTVTWKQSKLKKATYYKYYVVAYKTENGKNNLVAKSQRMHVVTAGSKYGNPVKVKVNRSSVSLKAGRTCQLKVAVTNSTKKVRLHTSKVRYLSTNPSVATVSKSGKIKGVGKGKCNVYCYAQNGLYRKVKVVVK